MNNNLDHLILTIARALSHLRGRFLVAVSGGIDSVVLCAAVEQLGLPFDIAHANFQLRGEESVRDEQFVRRLGEQYKADVFVERFDTEQYSIQHKVSIQVAAREMRYEWFHRLMSAGRHSNVLLAHHADDNIETIAMNFFRGTGITGLTGMPSHNGRIIRPMLDIRRTAIKKFAEDNHLEWVEDSSNSESKYTRNFFRHEVLPALGRVYESVDVNLLNNIRRFKKISAFYHTHVADLKKQLLEANGQEVRIPVRKLLKSYPEVMLFEIISDYGFTEGQLDDAFRLLTAQSGKYMQSATHQLIKHRDWLIIAKKGSRADLFVIDETVTEFHYPGGTLRFTPLDKTPANLDAGASSAFVNTSVLEYPLVLRRWKTGDYFYPFGFGKKKKLSRFFIDNKLSLSQKESVWVLESAKRIIWIIGWRSDDRFRIVDRSRPALLITNEH